MSKVKQTKVPMNKTTKIILIVLSSVLAAIMISFVILAFIPVKGFAREELQDYLFVNIYDQSSPSPRVVVKNEAKLASGQTLSADEKNLADLFYGGLASTGYTAFRAAFEQSYLGNLRAETDIKKEEIPIWDEETKLQKRHKKTDELLFETVEETVVVQYTKKEMLDATLAAEGSYVLEFFYAEQGQALKELEVKGPDGKMTVAFDRMRVVISDSENAIKEFKMFLYDSGKMDADAPEADAQRATAVLVRANTSTFIERLTDLFEYLKTGRLPSGN